MTELAAWYQKKIGTYDKQEWETTIEQRIIQGSRQTPLKSTKLQPDLIDIDLVRGSSFPKAKPVQGTSTVVRLALARVLLFPFWKHWWTAHTSLSATRLFFSLWILQILNIFLYLIAPSSSNIDSTCILVTFLLMCGLGVTHAFIVSTTHPHPTNHWCRSVNHDRKRSCLLSHGTDDNDIFRCSNINGESNNQSIDALSRHISVNVINVATQTNDMKNDEKDNTSENMSIPSLSLTPPIIHGVKFNLDNDKKKVIEDNNSPILRHRRNHSSRLTQISVEDDGFESLNGNNSNGSENGEDPSNYNAQKKATDSNHVNFNDQLEQYSDNSNILYKEKTLKRPISKINPAGRKCHSFRCTKESEFWDNDNNESKDSNIFENMSASSGNTVRFRCGPQVCSDGGSSTNLSGDQGHCESDEWWDLKCLKIKKEKHTTRTESHIRKPRKDRDSRMSSSSEEECDTASASLGAPSQNADFAQTTNSEECSYCSEPDESESEGLEGDSAWEPFTILNPASDRVSCTIWENGRVIKIPMSVVEISHAIVRRAELALNRNDGGLFTGTLIAGALAALPTIIHLLQILAETGNDQVTVWDLPGLFFSNSPFQLICSAIGATFWERIINLVSAFLRLGLGALIFFLLAVAQRAFNQRFFYAKLFSHLTSARRARQSSLPHFRLNRVRNIKTWLSVRSYLMRRGPQRSVDIIVSSAFILLVLLISFLVFDLLQDQNQGDLSRTAETLSWAVALGVYLLRLVALGTRANRKHRCLPVLLTEQINLHLAMERRPANKERLAVANNVLKLAADLLKELESPFKISGLSANPYLYTITKVVVLSALSGVLSEILGFKLKLHKIKIK